MTTIWRANPAVSYWSINELRDAIQLVGGSPPEWTGAARLPAGTRVRAAHVLEVKEAIQRLWDDRDLGLIPNWTTGVEPGLPAPTQPSILIRDTDILNLRDWFNHWEGWGNLRGVHWFDSGRSDLTGIFWNVETVIGVTKENAYHRTLVNDIRGYCVAARNRGLVNIVRIDWQEGLAVPTNSDHYYGWKENFNQAVNALKDVATIFVVGNEPTKEPGMYASEYVAAFNYLYANRVADTKYLAAGPAAFDHHQLDNNSDNPQEIDTLWLERVSEGIDALDGWALHTYGSPWLRYAEGPGPSCVTLCIDPTEDCLLSCGNHSPLTGDASFRRYRQFMDAISPKWAEKPVYITETNTQGFLGDSDEYNQPTPAQSYVNNWIRLAYEEIRRFNNEKNADRTNWPRILCLCWFVDTNRGNTDWVDYALSNDQQPKLQQARSDFKASDTSTGISPGNPTSNLAPWVPILEHRTGTRVLSGTIS